MIQTLFTTLFITLILAGASDAVFAAKKHSHNHSLSAHEHGAVKLAFAIEGKTLEIDMEGPAESFIGFEHAPKTEAEKLAFKRAHSIWTTELLSKVIMFDGKLNCRVESASFEQILENKNADQKGKKSGEHSEISAKAQLLCEGAPFKGTEVKIGVVDKFPKITELSLEILGTETKSLRIKKAIESVRL